MLVGQELCVVQQHLDACVRGATPGEGQHLLGDVHAMRLSASSGGLDEERSGSAGEVD